ncbi:MAG: EF-P lysine aminoacylase GenX [Proteobacteria bacterium]|nr:EF-P lysine aminoacylase GenX [Pseudomonadota bacterium]
MIRAIRGFLDARGSLEVETPALVRSPGVDVHLDAIEAGGGYLATSPEYHMKRLLADGSGPIHQLGKAWRAGEVGAWHEPEFSMLEWYVPGADDAALMDETEALVRHAAAALDVSLGDGAPFDRITYREAFDRHAGFDPTTAERRRYGMLLRASGTRAPKQASDADLEDLVIALVVQRELGKDRPVFVTDWPASRAALARVRPGRDADGAVSAARFELYWRGAELCNGYHELTDASEQRARIERDNAARIELGKDPYPVDEDFLGALERGLPDCAGNALGLDRLLMVLTGADDIGDVRTFRVAL